MIVLFVILALLILIFFVPYGIDVSYIQGAVKLGVKAGPLRLWILPKKPLTPRQQERAEKKKKQKAKKKAAKKAAGQSEPMEETLKVKAKKPLDVDFLLALLKMAIHAIKRFFRSFRIDFLQLCYIVATRDPYETAVQYSYLCAGMDALLPAACDVIHVKKKDIRLDMDFVADTPYLEARVVLSLQLFRIVHLAVAFAVEFLRWKIKHRNSNKAEANERTDDYGRQQNQRTHGYNDDQDQAAG